MRILGVGLLLAVLGSPAASPLVEPRASLTGCGGTATSTDAQGAVINTVVAPTAEGASSSNPFVVDYDGTVTYSGHSDAVITDHQWRLALDGITIRTGGSPNAGRTFQTKGSVVVKDFLPLRVTGLYYVSGDVRGAGGGCAGGIWLKLRGNPATTVPFWLAAMLMIGGLVGLWFSRPTGPNRHPVRGGLTGLLAGVGLVLLLVLLGAAPFTSLLPFILIPLIAAAVGVTIGVIVPSRAATG